jgi:hypothetical protein
LTSSAQSRPWMRKSALSIDVAMQGFFWFFLFDSIVAADQRTVPILSNGQ